MSLVRYNTNYDDFVPSTFNGFVNRFINDQQTKSPTNETKFLPNVDVIEKENAFELQVALPGMKKEGVELEVADNILTLKGERKMESEKAEGRYYSFETQYGSFKRSFKLPKNVDQAKVDASFENGILKINLSKIDEQELKTTIKIK
jgi:HSP20 family protein